MTMMKAISNQVTLLLLLDLMVLTQLLCMDLALMLATQFWLLDKMENFTLLKVKMDGTGQDMVFKRTNGLSGLNGLRTLISM